MVCMVHLRHCSRKNGVMTEPEAKSNVLASLRRVDIFRGLSDDELLQVASLSKVLRIPAEYTIFREGEDGNELFILQSGRVRVSLNTRSPDNTMTLGTINMLYEGQSFGEMVLLDGTSRSATVVSVEPCVLLVITEHDFASLCDSNPRIGYLVLRNLACDLAYKLRSSNLLLRGNIRWKHGELAHRSHKS